MKCSNCRGFGYVQILNEADEIIEMECPVCEGSGEKK
jgi:DnaJ-class molecular chaperone